MLGTGHRVELVVHRGAGAYICGEETALLDSLEGKRGNPRLKPPFPAIKGLYDGPTLINNVETLSNVPHIVNNGADWFKSFGTEQSPGTKVVSVSGCVQRPGNYEVELGIPSRDLIYDLAGGPPPGGEVKAWFPGGSSAPVLTEAELDLPYTFEDMPKAGSMLGSGSIIVADDTVSIPELALRTARFYHHESCGKCTPCREGTNWTVKMLERVIRGEATPMDLDVIASVQENIIGHCLCVLGDSMAMPVGSMVAKFRDEFEEAIEEAPGGRRAASRPEAAAGSARERAVGLMAERPPDHARRRRRSRSTAPEGEMLVDAAKHGDVEIPVFCYEPKLGDPVGACRMCLVEIEGIPKLQTACSTPVRDGMVVYTRTDRVKAAQKAVVEFLLVNHPLDCPVCDKGGECPLQDIAMGWGPGQSRFTDPKRHFQKPIPLSPLVRIDRERCILCYRCVRFSQEVAEDEQLQLLEPRRRQLRRDLRRPPLHRPLPRQHHRALPGGGADLGGLPVPRPALGHRGRGLDLHALPEPVQRQVHGPRRAGRAGPGARQPRGRRRLALRQGPVRLPDDRLRGADHRAPGRAARGPSWDQALDAVAERLRAAGSRAAAIVGGRASNEEGYLVQRIVREALGSPQRHLRRRARSRRPARPLRAPELGAAVSDLDRAESILVLGADPLNVMPILDLRMRKAIRHAAPGSRSPPSARPRSTAAPRRRPLRARRAAPSWPRWRRRSGPATRPGEASSTRTPSGSPACSARRDGDRLGRAPGPRRRR